MKLNIYFFFGLIFLSIPTSWAETQFNSFFSYYSDDNNLSVLTPMLRVIHDVNSDLNISLAYSFERFDKDAPINADQAEVVTGASTVAGGVGTGFEENRNELSMSSLLNTELGRIGAGLYTSDEDDFSSNGFSLSWSQDFAQKNFTLGGQLALTQDKIYDIANASGFPKTKSVNAFAINMSQLINTRLYIHGGINYMNISGFQSSPLRSILVEEQGTGGTSKLPANEQHPNNRQRANLYFGFKQYFLTRSAIDTSISLYDDSWGVFATGLRVHYYQYLTANIWGRLRLQYYAQSQADFYQSTYQNIEAIMTADNRLRDYDSRMLGIKIAYKLRRAKLRDWEISTAYDRYSETNQGLSANIFKVMLKMLY